MIKIELFYEPLDIKSCNNVICEMTDSQLAFLCGVIQAEKPRKIVEVGVSHGGTTCVIIQCLKLLGYPVELHSVDISKECYKVRGKRTGYVVDETFEKMPDSIQHYWHLGAALPTQLESIGGDIDLLILDTMHIMPGEMLDFLAAFPYLAKEAVVLLHDIVLNQISIYDCAYATRVLYDVVVAEKIIADGVDPTEILPSIGAFKITDDTNKYIEKCFSALAITWRYNLQSEMIEQYKQIYQKFYDDCLVQLFDKVVMLNSERMSKEKYKKIAEKETIKNFHEVITDKYKVVLYGGGEIAERISSYLERIGRKVDAYIVSDGVDINKCRIKENIYQYSDIPFLQAECNLIFAVSPEKHEELAVGVENSQFHEIYPSAKDDYARLINFIDEYIC